MRDVEKRTMILTQEQWINDRGSWLLIRVPWGTRENFSLLATNERACRLLK